ncbi:MAG: dipeptidase [archaeon GB-1867-005]|nr:dipeptidase [Candidatus Culexmicrobium cathedralense]
MKSKKYDGYTSYQYLEERVDFKPYMLVKQIGRVPSSTIPLTKSEEERVQEILEKYVVISLHDHLEVYPEDPSQIPDYIKRGRMWIAYEGLAASGLDGVFAGLYDGVGSIESRDPWAWENIIYQIGMFLSDLKHQNFAILAEKVDDIIRAHNEGRVAVVIHLEGTPNIGSNLDKIDVLYGLGVRCMGITYSQGNHFGSGLADEKDVGLTDLGYKLIDRMNKLGIAIDLAHASDKTSLEVIEASRYPVFITHAGARALWPTRRMKPDEVIQALAEKGGVIGVEAAPHTTLTLNRRKHTIESVMEHFEYIAKLVGIDYVAFGPDTIFGDHVAIHQIFREELAISKTKEGIPPYEEVDYVDGLENPSEFINIIRWLVKHGYSDNEIAKVIGGNILRVLNKTWK